MPTILTWTVKTTDCPVITEALTEIVYVPFDATLESLVIGWVESKLS